MTLERKAISVIAILLIINIAWTWLKKEDKDYSFYQTEYNHIKGKIDSLNTEIKTQTNEINEIKYKMDVKDSVIRAATPVQLDSLFTSFFDRTRLR